MDITLFPRLLKGTVQAPSSKSVAHRALILAALADEPTTIGCTSTSQDIDATVGCLNALGATISHDEGQGFSVAPLPRAENGAPVPVRDAALWCGESGSTLRFMMPLVAALGGGALLQGAPRLLERPLSPLDAQLAAHGVTCELTPEGVAVSGQMSGGTFSLPGNVSSQFVSGLLLATSALKEPVSIQVEEPVASVPYIDLTCDGLAAFGSDVAFTASLEQEGVLYTLYQADPFVPHLAEPRFRVEGDWSGAAFWLAAGALGSQVEVQGLSLTSDQGDRAVLGALALLGSRITRNSASVKAEADAPQGHDLSMEQIPDLVPPIAAVAALCPGTTRLCGLSRLRIKESDRVETVRAGLSALGASVSVEGDDLVICGVEELSGGVVDAANDHRIAMMAAIAATRATGPVTICGAQCVAKSYPAFFESYKALGGSLEVRP